MQSNWKEFLNKQGATLIDDVVCDFGDAAAELTATAQGTVLADLGQFGTLRVSGEDAQSFLQNLLSNDIREVSATQSQFSSFNSAKGRMLANFLISRESDDYLLQLPASLTEAMRKKLSMYVMRAKVKITDISNELIILGLSGNSAPHILQAQGWALPESVLGLSQNQTACIIKYSDSRYQINLHPEQAEALWMSLHALATPVGSASWDWFNIRAGLPVILPATQEQFVPQMANFDLIGGINFKKGCYPGQEIVARMHYLGKLKRRMYLAHVDSATAPQAGDELYGTEPAGQSCGMIANAAVAPQGGYDVLAVIQSESHDANAVHLSSGAQLQFEALPYPLP
jgi:folate-binding protein YgfZ